MKEKSTKKSNKGGIRIKKSLLIALIVALIIAIIVVSGSLYLLSWKEVYVVVKGTKVYNYQMFYETYNQAKVFKISALDFLQDNPKYTFLQQMIVDVAKREIISNRLLYLSATNEGITTTEEEIEKAVADFKEEATKGSDNPEQAIKDELDIYGLNEKTLRALLRENIIVEKKKSELTKHISVSEKEVVDYFEEWREGYVKEEGNKESYFKANYEQIKKDALDMKRKDYLTQVSRNLVEDNASSITFDNAYKRFMRWLYGRFFGTTIPEEYEPQTL